MEDEEVKTEEEVVEEVEQEQQEEVEETPNTEETGEGGETNEEVEGEQGVGEEEKSPEEGEEEPPAEATEEGESEETEPSEEKVALDKLQGEYEQLEGKYSTLEEQYNTLQAEYRNYKIQQSISKNYSQALPLDKEYVEDLVNKGLEEIKLEDLEAEIDNRYKDIVNKRPALFKATKEVINPVQETITPTLDMSYEEIARLQKR